jgi:hypothetical protein
VQTEVAESKTELGEVKTELGKINESLTSLSVDVKKIMKFNVAMLSQVSNMLVPVQAEVKDALNVLAEARIQAATTAVAADVALSVRMGPVNTPQGVQHRLVHGWVGALPLTLEEAEAAPQAVAAYTVYQRRTRYRLSVQFNDRL